MAIARAVIRRPEIYLFDDSFSALDLTTDARLRAALAPVTRDAAVVIVAQRVATIRHADRIVVMEDGAVVGTRHPRRAARRPARPTARSSQSQLTAEEVRMSTKEATGRPGTLKETERVQAGPGPGRGPMGGGMIGQKADTFWPSLRRLLARLRPERHKAYAVLVLTVVSVAATAVGPRILGRATDLIFAGLIGKDVLAGGADAGAGRRRRCARRATTTGPTCSPRWT